MPAFRRAFNPYSSVPPPPASLPDYEILRSSIKPLTDEQAGLLIDSFLQTQDGKVLTLHRLADHLLGRTQVTNADEIEELGSVLEEERRREAGIVHIQPDDTNPPDEIKDEGIINSTDVPNNEAEKKRARKEERRMKKEKAREKRKGNETQDYKQKEKSKKPKKEKGDTSGK